MVERAERLDFELLVDRLEEVIVGASRVPFGSRVMVDQQDCASIIDQMRLTLPRQLQDAFRIIAERDSILDQARMESERIIEQAHQQASGEALHHEIVRIARSNAAEIEQRAESDARRAREEMDEYARQVLARLTSRVEATLRALKTGALDLERSHGISERHLDTENGHGSHTDRRQRTTNVSPFDNSGEPT
jgi:vacuolar-type H+-ATPase subunit H